MKLVMGSIGMILSLLTLPAYGEKSFWQTQQVPIMGSSESIGGFSNGCIIGAAPLNLTSDNYQVLRSQNHRYYGHPDLIAYLERMTHQANDQSLGTVLIGDMSMPAGGRFESGHASHQTGLDADIWLQLPTQKWSEQELQKPRPLPLVESENLSIIHDRWDMRLYKLIKIAASDDRIARIFVNPGIKKQLCKVADHTGDTDRKWLRYVRPWHYHEYHMHVRLTCPKGDLECQDQAPVPAGDGCGTDLDGWFLPKKPKNDDNSTPKKAKKPVLPERCELIAHQYTNSHKG